MVPEFEFTEIHKGFHVRISPPYKGIKRFPIISDFETEEDAKRFVEWEAMVRNARNPNRSLDDLRAEYTIVKS